jgi:hypothetical protein
MLLIEPFRADNGEIQFDNEAAQVDDGISIP